MSNAFLPLCTDVVHSVLKLIRSEGTATPRVVALISRDPSLVFRTLAAANLFKIESGGQPEVFSLATAVVTLGVTQLEKVCRDAMDEPCDLPADVYRCYQDASQYSVLSSRVAEILALELFKSAVDDAKLLGYANYIGDMLAILALEHRYLELLEKYGKRTKIQYYLQKDFGLNPQEMAVRFLRECTIPKGRAEILSEQSDLVSTDALRLRTIVLSAGEFIEAQRNNRLDVFAPGSALPTRSALRGIKLSPAQHKSLYSSVESLFQTPEEPPVPCEDLNAKATALEERRDLQEEPSAILEVDIDEEHQMIMVSSSADQSPPKHIEPPCFEAFAPPSIHELLIPFLEIFETAQDSAELLDRCLEQILIEGSFKRAAILSMNSGKKEIICIRECTVLESEESFESALKNSFAIGKKYTQVRSFAASPATRSPFGSKAYALGPLDISTEHPSVLYVDCGDESLVPFYSRKFFRQVLLRVNQTLLEIPYVSLDLLDEESGSKES